MPIVQVSIHSWARCAILLLTAAAAATTTADAATGGYPLVRQTKLTSWHVTAPVTRHIKRHLWETILQIHTHTQIHYTAAHASKQRKRVVRHTRSRCCASHSTRAHTALALLGQFTIHRLQHLRRLLNLSISLSPNPSV